MSDISIKDRLTREAWESFLIGNKKVGLIHRITVEKDGVYSTDFLTAFDMGGKKVMFKLLLTIAWMKKSPG